MTNVRVYASVEGAKQGTFKSDGAAHDLGLEGVAFSYRCEQPLATTGQASGKRRHAPVVFTRASGAATPQFLGALYTNENLKRVHFSFVAGAGHSEVVVQTITLTNAKVVRVEHRLAIDPSDAPIGGALLDEVSFSFQKIEVVNVPAKTQTEDDWV